MNIQINKPHKPLPGHGDYFWHPTVELEPGDRLMVKLASGGPVIRIRLSEDGNFCILADTPDDQKRGGKISNRAGTRPGIYEIADCNDDEESS